MDEMLQRLMENSILGLLLAIFLWFTWRGGAFLGREIFLPLKQRIILHIDRLDDATTSMQGWIKAQGKLIEDQTRLIENQTRLIQHQADESDQHAETLDRIDQNVKELRQDSRRFFSESHSEHEKRSELLDRELDKQEE